MNRYFVYNLALTSPSPVEFSGGQVLFSPQGVYIVHIALMHPSHTAIRVRDARTGTLAYQSEFDFVAPPGPPGNKCGVARWGFGTDSV